MFIFAIYGIQIIGGQLARCNDRTYYEQQVCSKHKTRQKKTTFIMTYQYVNTIFTFSKINIRIIEIMSWNFLEKTSCIKNEY